MNWVPMFVLALPLVLSCRQAPAMTLAQAHARGFLVAGIVAAPSPFGGAIDGKAAGFDAALIDGFAKSSQLEIRQQAIAADDIEKALRSGAIDFVASSVEITVPLQASLRFASPDAEATRYYLKRKADGGIKTIADLNGKTFGSLSSSSRLTEITEFEHRLAKAGGCTGRAGRVRDLSRGREALAAKQIDYVIGDIADLEALVRDAPNAFEIGEPISQRVYVAWAAAKDSPEIAGAVRITCARLARAARWRRCSRNSSAGHLPTCPMRHRAELVAGRDKPAVFPIPRSRIPTDPNWQSCGRSRPRRSRRIYIAIFVA